MTDRKKHFVSTHDAHGALLWRWGINSDLQAETPVSVRVDGVEVWRSTE